MSSRSLIHVNASRKLTYEDQFKFKRAWQKLHAKNDIFYFDYVTGVDARTDEDIPGLTANGSLTWEEADKILCKHFKI